jgi:hypothetical protein
MNQVDFSGRTKMPRRNISLGLNDLRCVHPKNTAGHGRTRGSLAGRQRPHLRNPVAEAVPIGTPGQPVGMTALTFVVGDQKFLRRNLEACER